MKKIYFIAFVLFSVALCFSGCTSSEKTPDLSAPKSSASTTEAPAGSQDATGSEVIEPEELISKEEAEQLLGEAVKEGEKSEQAVVGQKICFYSAQNDDAGPFLQIAITQAAFMKNDSQTPQSIYTTLKESLSETAEQKQVDGIGDEYFFGTPGLHILKDGYYLSIAAGNLEDDEVQDILKQASALAIENLEKILGQ